MNKKKNLVREALEKDMRNLSNSRNIKKILLDPKKNLPGCFPSVEEALVQDNASPDVKELIESFRKDLLESVIKSDLKPGTKGEDVANLQKFLIMLGFLKVPSPTGFYGDKTKESVKHFQVDTGILSGEADKSAGITGPRTREKIYAITAVISNMLTDVLVKSGENAGTRGHEGEEPHEKPLKTLAPGDKGEAVERLQQALIDLGYLRIDKPTGEFGEKTRKALSNLQIDHGIIPSSEHPYAGYFGEKTAAKFIEILESLKDPAKKKDISRLYAQKTYLHAVEEKYSSKSKDPLALAGLYRVNGCKRNYVDELRALNKSLPPMSEKCKISICFPAYNEERNIEKTLQGWVLQMDPKTGKPLDPETFEILILINRPDGKSRFDGTLAKIQEFKRRYPQHKIHAVEHTFNFDKESDRNVEMNGRKFKVPKGLYMGTIYKLGQDLALMRNLDRKDDMSKARHLFRSNGADTESRNPYFLDMTFGYFEKDTDLDRYRSRSDYPMEAYKKMPLYHIAHRVRTMMNIIYSKDKRRSPIKAPGSNLGLGTYRAGLYASAGGFSIGRQIAEEVNLSQKISRLHPKNKTNLVVNAIGNPRRSIIAMKKGVALYHEYGKFEDSDDIRSTDWRKELESIPPHARLDIPNLERELGAILTGYVRIMMKNGVVKTEKEAFDIAAKMMSRCMTVFGVGITPVTDSHGKKTIIRNFEFLFDDVGKKHKVKINNIDYLKKLLGDFQNRPERKWE